MISALVVLLVSLSTTEPSAASPLASFDWTYRGQPEPGNRHWSSPDGRTWTETYPSGKQETQSVVAPATIGGCAGVVTTKPAEPSLQSFIPNPGCPRMILLFHLGDGPWRPLGEMRGLMIRTPDGAMPANTL